MTMNWGSKEIKRIEKLHMRGIITNEEKDENIKNLLEEKDGIDWSWIALFVTVVLMEIIYILKTLGRI